MNKIIIKNSMSNSSQSNNSDSSNPLSPKRQEVNSEIKKMPSQNETPLSSKGNVKSYCRIRPNNTIYSFSNKFTIENNNKTLSVDFTPENDRGNPSKQIKIMYNFTEIFGENTKNIEIYQKICKTSVEELFSKHKNSLIFVYGITNSGKTYTVNGDLENPGILQYSLSKLVEEFKKLKEKNDEWKLTCTYIEIYNEEIFDLLSVERNKLKLAGSSNKFYPQGAIIKNIKEYDDFTNAFEIGEFNRSKGNTNSNPYSSRSHAIFRVELSYKGNSDKNKIYLEPVSLCIVDLAGAERVSKSGVKGNGLKEAGNINKSLHCLKKCFKAMEANSKNNCLEKKEIVPVRESKLTLLFKEYFVAHQNISIICTINPDRNEMLDIRSVLDFGSHAMKVKTIKSWIETNNYNSRDMSPTNSGNRNNSPLPKVKRYRMFTNKKYLDKNYNSKEKDNKCKEDNNSNDSSFSNKKYKNFFSSGHKLVHSKLKGQNITQNISLNFRPINPSNDENSINNSNLNLNYEERKKCTTNPFQLLPSNNFFLKYSASKEKQNLEEKMKQKEMKENLSKKGDDIKHAVASILKKMYYENLNQSIEAYENQCKNIDLYEIEMLLSKNSNRFYTFKNPFIKNYEEDKKIFCQNLKICGDNNLVFTSDITLSRNNNNKILDDLINLRYEDSNEHEHDQTKINDYLDRSLEQYQPTNFKAYFGIGESLIKKAEDENKIKE